MILNESLFESIDIVEYKPVSNINKFKKYADEILGGYGGMSDSDIKRDIEEIYIDGELKGYIGLSKYNEEDGTKLLGIGNFMIIERGKGYGTQVINDLVSKYKNEFDLIYCFVDADNTGAISLYKKLGKVYDKDGPNDNDQYYVTFYDNGKYELEENFNTNSIIVYHGSNAKFNKFDLKYFGRTDDGMWGKGIYFISDKRVAQSFGSDYLYTCKLKLNKPYIIDMSTVGNNEDSEDSSKYYSLTNRNNDVLKRKGYDSIIVKDELWEGSFTTRANEYIVFDPSDIEIIDVKDLSLEEDMVSENLTEAKKRKKKKISQVNPGEAIFKSVTDMQKWVKKRQKGMSPFCYLNPNAGNVPLSNNIFNSMFSSDGSSGVGTSEGGVSNGGLSVGGSDAGGGMGESFNPDLKLKLYYTRSLSDYLTDTEQDFIRNNMDLIDGERWLELRDKVDNTFDYPLTTIAIFKFLADGLGYDFKYFEELLKLE